MIRINPGTRFGRLVVLDVVQGSGGRGKKIKFHCLCDCGKRTTPTSEHLRHGNSKSCGCLQIEATRARSTTHGHKVGGKSKETRTYKSWRGMVDRCNNPNIPGYKWYGARGIKVCRRWRKFENFYADMGDRPEGHTLDRIDVNGDYEPANCGWATLSAQAQNTRRNICTVFEATRMDCVRAVLSFGA